MGLQAEPTISESRPGFVKTSEIFQEFEFQGFAKSCSEPRDVMGSSGLFVVACIGVNMNTQNQLLDKGIRLSHRRGELDGCSTVKTGSRGRYGHGRVGGGRDRGDNRQPGQGALQVGDSDPIGHRARIDRVGIGYTFEATDRGDHDNYTALPTAHSLRSWVTRGRSGSSRQREFRSGFDDARIPKRACVHVDVLQDRRRMSSVEGPNHDVLRESVWMSGQNRPQTPS